MADVTAIVMIRVASEQLKDARKRKRDAEDAALSAQSALDQARNDYAAARDSWYSMVRTVAYISDEDLQDD